MPQILPHERITAAIRNAARAERRGPRALRHRRLSGQGRSSSRRCARSPRSATSSRSACRSATRWPTASRSSGPATRRSRAASRCAGSSPELEKPGELPAPVVLMSYLNPLLAFGFDKLAAAAVAAHVGGFIVPDLPLEESAELARAARRPGPRAHPPRHAGHAGAARRELCAASRGFVYAVTVTGITGGARGLPAEVTGYLDRVQRLSTPAGLRRLRRAHARSRSGP